MSNEVTQIEEEKNIKRSCHRCQQQGCTKAKATGIVYRVKLPPSQETELVTSELSFKKGDRLVAETRYGVDLVEVVGETSDYGCQNEFVRLIRPATKEDLAKSDEQHTLAKAAFFTARKKINEHKLEMKLVTVHYLLEENKILFLFTADQRVDFRELVKDFVATFHARIELRQIGVRDETRVLGGLAVCGRDYCCHGVTDQLKPVTIKMVKDQNLSLNSVKISGSCGRLLCCLAYEHEFYAEERKTLPSDNTRVKINDEQWRVSEVNVISKKILLTAEDGRLMNLELKNFKKDKEGRWQVSL